MASRKLPHLNKRLSSLRPIQEERSLPSSPVRQSHGVTTYIPDSIHTGLQAISLFETLDSTEEVARWLQMYHLPKYIPAFRKNGVTGRLLLGLTNEELRDVLGVRSLKDRRTIMDGICYLEDTLIGGGGSNGYPEDGRILTHLSNERLVLIWIRYAVIAQTIATATLFFLGDMPAEKSHNSILVTACVLCVAGIVALLVSNFVHCIATLIIYISSCQHHNANSAWSCF